MNRLKFSFSLAILMIVLQVSAVAQSSSFTDTFKEHMNETVENVKSAEDADEKRELLNESFDKMIKALDTIRSKAELTEEELAMLDSYREGIVERSNQLNGLDGFDEIADEDLEDFSEYSQQEMEQADRFITLSITTALLIVLILLLL